MKSILLRISLLLTSTLVCFGLLEYVARQGLSYVARKSVNDLGGNLEADPGALIEYTPRGRRLVPNADVVINNHYISSLDVDIKTNALGLRDVERSTQAAAGTHRIVFLGDSIVVQDYLPSEKTLPVLVEKALNSIKTKNYEVINAGLANAGLEEEIQLLTDIIDHLNPELILLSFYLNDSRPAWGYAGEIGAQRGWFRKHSVVIESIVRELEVRQWLSDSNIDRFSWMSLVDSTPWRTDRAAFMKMVDQAPYDWGSAWRAESWPAVSRHLSALKELAALHNAKLAVVSMPVRYQVEADFVEDEPQRALADVLKGLGIPHLSLLSVEREHRHEALFFDWCHPTERGNQILTSPIADYIKEQLKEKER